MKTKRLTSVHVSCDFFLRIKLKMEKNFQAMTCDRTDYENDSYI